MPQECISFHKHESVMELILYNQLAKFRRPNVYASDPDAIALIHILPLIRNQNMGQYGESNFNGTMPKEVNAFPKT